MHQIQIVSIIRDMQTRVSVFQEHALTVSYLLSVSGKHEHTSCTDRSTVVPITAATLFQARYRNVFHASDS